MALLSCRGVVPRLFAPSTTAEVVVGLGTTVVLSRVPTWFTQVQYTDSERASSGWADGLPPPVLARPREKPSMATGTVKRCNESAKGYCYIAPTDHGKDATIAGILPTDPRRSHR